MLRHPASLQMQRGLWAGHPFVSRARCLGAGYADLQPSRCGRIDGVNLAQQGLQPLHELR